MNSKSSYEIFYGKNGGPEQIRPGTVLPVSAKREPQAKTRAREDHWREVRCAKPLLHYVIPKTAGINFS